MYTPLSPRRDRYPALDSGVDIIKVKDLLGHWHLTATQMYFRILFRIPIIFRCYAISKYRNSVGRTAPRMEGRT